MIDLVDKNGFSLNQVKDFDPRIVTDYETVKERIRQILLNYQIHKEELTQVPHYIYGEFAVAFAVYIPEVKEKYAVSRITDELMKAMGVDQETLLKQALINLGRYEKSYLNDVARFSMDESGKVAHATVSKTESSELMKNGLGRRLYVLTNECFAFGAAGILQEGLLQSIAESCDSDLIVIMSSVHEVIIAKYVENADFDNLSEFITMINEESVQKKEQLSNRAYIYDRKEQGLRLSYKDSILELTAMRNIPIYNIECLA